MVASAALRAEPGGPAAPVRIELDADAFDPMRVASVRHNLAGHPLLQLPSLVELAQRLAPRGSVRYHGAGATAGTDFIHAPETHRVEGRPEDILRDADVAMYHAKARGKGRFVIFDPTLHVAAIERRALRSELERTITASTASSRRALPAAAAADAPVAAAAPAMDDGHEHMSPAGRLLLEYQPIRGLRAGDLVAAEALVRWQHPENRGFLRALAGLQAAAEQIQETEEAERCALFLRQLDPSWPPPDLGEA